MSPQRFCGPELPEFKFPGKRSKPENAVTDVVFEVDTGITVMHILKSVHEVERVFIIIINLVAWCYIKEEVGQGAKGAASKYIEIEIA